MSNKAKINIIGNIFGTAGYAMHTRNLANALNELIDVKLMCQLPMGWEQNINDKELLMIKREDADTNLIITMPHQWKLYADKKINIGFLVWEGDKIPQSWAEELLNPNINYVFVPSEHTKNAILNTIKLKEDFIKVMPHGVSSIFSPQKPAKTDTSGNLDTTTQALLDNEDTTQRKKDIDDGSNDNISGDTKPDLGKTIQDEQMPSSADNHVEFKFFANKGFTNLEDRGGIQYLLKAYNEEFKKDENVELLVKINPAYGIPNLDKLLLELGYNQDSPKLTLMVKSIPYEELPKLYQDCNVFVSPTRAEAFNLPCLESLACGKPVISTTFGGQTDYLNTSNSFLIDGELKEVEHDIIYEGIRWLTPDIKELKESLRFAYNNPQILKNMSSECLKTAQMYTWEATAKKIVELLR